MATEVWLTDGVVRAVAGQVQQLSQAVLTSAYDQADLTLTIVGIEGGTPSTVTIQLLTGNSLDSEDGWYVAQAFANVTTANPGTTYANVDKKNVPGLQKYLRWKVLTITGASAVSFTIRGMLRNN